MDQLLFNEIFNKIKNNPNFYFKEYRGRLILTIHNKFSYNLNKMTREEFIGLVQNSLLLCQTDNNTFLNYNFIDFIELKISGRSIIHAHRKSSYTLSNTKLEKNIHFFTQIKKKFMNYSPKNSSNNSYYLINTKNIDSFLSKKSSFVFVANEPFIETSINFMGQEQVNQLNLFEEPGKEPFKDILNNYLKTKLIMEEL